MKSISRTISWLIPFCAFIKLVSPQAAQIENTIVFLHCIISRDALFEDNLLIYCEVRKKRKEEEETQHQAGFEAFKVLNQKSWVQIPKLRIFSVGFF